MFKYFKYNGQKVQYSILKLAIFTSLLLLNLLFSLLIAYTFIEVPSSHYYLKYLWMVPVYLFLYTYYRLLTRRMVMSSEFMFIEKANFFALIMVTLLIFAAKTSDQYSRSIILLFFALNLFIPIWVWFLKKKFMQLDIFREDIVVICDEQGREDVNNWFVKDNSFGFNIRTQIFTDKLSAKELEERIQEVVNSHLYYAAVISLGREDIDSTFKTLNYILHHMKQVFVLPKISKLPLFNSEFFNSINHKGMALFVKNKLLNPTDRMIKELFDKTVSVLLFILFFPLLLILYIVVYISTNGHPIFKQKRVGQNGLKFHIYKFRTMRIDADSALEEILESDPVAKTEWEKEFKLKDDPRITKVGKFLRRTSLDELPQIINVFQGKMSLVGPRPIVDAEVRKYGEMFDYFAAVKPGITGLWQVSGRNDISYEDRVQLDVWYVRNWSIELDIIILVKTVVIVLMRKGSY